MMLSRRIVLLMGFLVVVSIMLLAAPAWATGNDRECDHPRFLERGCGYEGEDGADGEDGRDGADGRDGVDGKDGRDGIDGKDGVVPTEWITETRNNHLTVNKWYQAARDVAAAEAAMQVHLPQDQTSRLTFGMSHLNSTTGIGIGYAYMIDNESNSALTLSVGHAGNETAVRGSFGFEFGGQRKMQIPAFTLSPAIPTPDPEPDRANEIFEQQQALERAQEELFLMADIGQEEYQAQQEQVSSRFAQQTNLIESQDQELAALKKEIEAALKERDKRDAVQAEKEAALREVFKK